MRIGDYFILKFLSSQLWRKSFIFKNASLSGADVISSAGDFVFGSKSLAERDFVIGIGLKPFFKSEKNRFVDQVRTAAPNGSSEKSEKVFPRAPRSRMNCAVLSEIV